MSSYSDIFIRLNFKGSYRLLWFHEWLLLSSCKFYLFTSCVWLQYIWLYFLFIQEGQHKVSTLKTFLLLGIIAKFIKNLFILGTCNNVCSLSGGGVQYILNCNSYHILRFTIMYISRRIWTPLITSLLMLKHSMRSGVTLILILVSYVLLLIINCALFVSKFMHLSPFYLVVTRYFFFLVMLSSVFQNML